MGVIRTAIHARSRRAPGPSFVAPERVALARETIHTGKGTDVAGARDFMEALLRREDTPLRDELTDELLACAAEPEGVRWPWVRSTCSSRRGLSASSRR